MRITIFGAAGQAGSRAVAEALDRGHLVTAVLRSPDRAQEIPRAAEVRIGDAADPEDVADLADGQDLVISATRPAAGRESELITTAATLTAATARTGTRLLLVGGAATLTVPGAGGVTVMDEPGFPGSLRAIARACADQLAVCRAATRSDWTYLSPPAQLHTGARTGRYRLGRDTLVVDRYGQSALSYADLAVVLLDEAERSAHRGMRFTAAY
ncbi:NAD(P)-dependent oxidoreductase [Nocardia carnea]|uniref:NAD(P)-dependent oxidoreductase n=1 Tax=Nocardia carnea TaxID=37328 RepID=UPI0024558B50|nr:NAD(P)H-binding protein [Nocardia carnea]